VREIFTNLDTLLARAQSNSSSLPVRLGSQTMVKVYLRNREDLAMVERLLRDRLPESPLLVLQGDVCRAELLVELDCLARVGPAYFGG
jgi:chorismate lyase/3-hydroxybenzoate synthase